MSSSFLELAFAHHVWATLRLIDVCLELSQEQLQTSVTGTRGPIQETIRHLVQSDAFDLFVLTDDRGYDLDATRVSPSEARGIMERTASGWATLTAGPLDVDEVVREVDEGDGFQRWAPVGFRLVGTLEHGTDHRSQICTALTTLGVNPPRISVIDFGLDVGRVVEKMPGA